MIRAFLISTLILATPAVARSPLFSLPIDCELGETCYIQHFVDNDPTESKSDFACGITTCDGHKGVDFALPSLKAMQNGVNVIAAAPETVAGFRESVDDVVYSDENAADVDGIECGNGVVISHGAGWVTRYCHLKKDSIVVKKGQRVAMGAILGQVGLSGKTQFPHVHLSVRHNGTVVDPFDPDSRDTCNPEPPTDTLWLEAPAYEDGGVISAGFATKVPVYQTVKDGDANEADITTTSLAFVLWGYGHMARKDDVLSLTIIGPDGEFAKNLNPITRNRALFFRATGKKRRDTPFAKGVYTGIVELLRDDQVIGTQTITRTLR